MPWKQAAILNGPATTGPNKGALIRRLKLKGLVLSLKTMFRLHSVTLFTFGCPSWPFIQMARNDMDKNVDEIRQFVL